MSAEQHKRKRARIACEPCRERKRKCNGENPCDTCTHFDYQCYFDSHMRKKRSTGLAFPGADDYQSEASPNGNPSANNHASTAQSHLRSMEANSGAAFMRKLALKMDPINAPKLSLFAWNLGSRGDYILPPRSVTDILTKPDMLSLASIYFETVHPAYGFVDRHVFMRNLEHRWLSPEMPHSYDAALCGVAALGSYFSNLKPRSEELELAKRALLHIEQSTSSAASSLDIVIGWMLRVVYLRLTASPHLAWMASCSAMHMIEAAGLHCEPSPGSVLQRPADDCDPEIRRRIFGVAQHINIWVSFDLGRSRIALRGTSSLPASPRPGDITTELFSFLPLSETLDPDNNPDTHELEAALSSVLDSVPVNYAPVLTQCNLMLCYYRRLRALNHTISGQLLDRVLALCARGVSSSRDLFNEGSRWHHVAYVPFQVICTLLAIDTRSSMLQLGAAMETLGAIAGVYDTTSMKEAYSTARLLVLLHQKRKEEDAKTLSTVLLTQPPLPLSNGTPKSVTPQSSNNPADLSWLGDFTTDMPGLQDFDWNQFLNDDGSWMPNA